MKTSEQIAANNRLMGLLLRHGDKTTIYKVKRAFRESNGSLREAAAKLGVAESTLHVWVRLPCFDKMKRRTREDAHMNLGRYEDA